MIYQEACFTTTEDFKEKEFVVFNLVKSFSTTKYDYIIKYIETFPKNKINIIEYDQSQTTEINNTPIYIDKIIQLETQFQYPKIQIYKPGLVVVVYEVKRIT